MPYLVVILLTVLSCVLFDKSKIKNSLDELLKAYKEQFRVMSDKSMADDQKQKELMQLIPKQLKGLGKLIFGIVLFISPFLSLFVLEYLNPELNPNILVTWWGLLLPILTVFVYIILKKKYGRL
ncbi:hypothetical protein [Eudoraea chungangensis]|uniref:hypothetical protein n=1 Tax=Eudoraea chungangensis TaxID=1481905 RepID=UPI0023ECE172|nr:hypothetical protein [Eudoraea chungangensis]